MAATSLAQRVLNNAGAWTCAHPRRPLHLYHVPGLRHANLCVLCAFDLGERCGFTVCQQQILETIGLLRCRERMRASRWTLEFVEPWLDHIEDCESCEHATEAVEMCRQGQRIFLERALRAEGGRA